MSINDAVSKLNRLKGIEPNENWVVSVRQNLLSNAPHCDVPFSYQIEKPSKVDQVMYIYETISGKYRFVPSVASVLVLFLVGSFFTVTAAKTSLPGDPLYSVKLANENIVLAVANDEDKPGVEMEIAGKRLEELNEISKKASDVEQQVKVEQLVRTFEEKIVSANEKMAKISQVSEKKKVAKVARQINNQTEKYKELLSTTNSNLPTVVKEKVTDKIASALNTTQKVNMDSLLILAESNQELDEKVVTNEEIKSIILKKVEDLNNTTAKTVENSDAGAIDVETDTKKASIDSVNGLVSDNKSAILESIAQNLENNNYVDAVKNVAEAQKIGENSNTAGSGTGSDTKDSIPDDSDPNDANDVNDKSEDTKTSGGGDGKINNAINPVPAE